MNRIPTVCYFWKTPGTSCGDGDNCLFVHNYICDDDGHCNKEECSYAHFKQNTLKILKPDLSPSIDKENIEMMHSRSQSPRLSPKHRSISHSRSPVPQFSFISLLSSPKSLLGKHSTEKQEHVSEIKDPSDAAEEPSLSPSLRALEILKKFPKGFGSKAALTSTIKEQESPSQNPIRNALLKILSQSNEEDKRKIPTGVPKAPQEPSSDLDYFAQFFRKGTETPSSHFGSVPWTPILDRDNKIKPQAPVPPKITDWEAYSPYVTRKIRADDKTDTISKSNDESQPRDNFPLESLELPFISKPRKLQDVSVKEKCHYSPPSSVSKEKIVDVDRIAKAQQSPINFPSTSQQINKNLFLEKKNKLLDRMWQLMEQKKKLDSQRGNIERLHESNPKACAPLLKEVDKMKEEIEKQVLQMNENIREINLALNDNSDYTNSSSVSLSATNLSLKNSLIKNVNNKKDLLSEIKPKEPQLLLPSSEHKSKLKSQDGFKSRNKESNLRENAGIINSSKSYAKERQSISPPPQLRSKQNFPDCNLKSRAKRSNSREEKVEFKKSSIFRAKERQSSPPLKLKHDEKSPNRGSISRQSRDDSRGNERNFSSQSSTKKRLSISPPMSKFKQKSHYRESRSNLNKKEAGLCRSCSRSSSRDHQSMSPESKSKSEQKSLDIASKYRDQISSSGETDSDSSSSSSSSSSTELQSSSQQKSKFKSLYRTSKYRSQKSNSRDKESDSSGSTSRSSSREWQCHSPPMKSKLKPLDEPSKSKKQKSTSRDGETKLKKLSTSSSVNRSEAAEKLKRRISTLSKNSSSKTKDFQSSLELCEEENKNEKKDEKPNENQNKKAKTELASSEFSKVKESDTSLEAPFIKYVDHGFHWCEHCNEFKDTAPEFISHLGEANHLAKVKKKQQLWLDKLPQPSKENVISSDPEIPLLTIPLQGMEFLRSITVSFYCSLCEMFIYTKDDASLHCETDLHVSRYKDHLAKNPLYECFYNKEKIAAFARYSVAKEKIKDCEHKIQDDFQGSHSTDDSCENLEHSNSDSRENCSLTDDSGIDCHSSDNSCGSHHSADHSDRKLGLIKNSNKTQHSTDISHKNHPSTDNSRKNRPNDNLSKNRHSTGSSSKNCSSTDDSNRRLSFTKIYPDQSLSESDMEISDISDDSTSLPDATQDNKIIKKSSNSSAISLTREEEPSCKRHKLTEQISQKGQSKIKASEHSRHSYNVEKVSKNSSDKQKPGHLKESFSKLQAPLFFDTIKGVSSISSYEAKTKGNISESMAKDKAQISKSIHLPTEKSNKNNDCKTLSKDVPKHSKILQTELDKKKGHSDHKQCLSSDLKSIEKTTLQKDPRDNSANQSNSKVSPPSSSKPIPMPPPLLDIPLPSLPDTSASSGVSKSQSKSQKNLPPETNKGKNLRQGSSNPLPAGLREWFKPEGWSESAVPECSMPVSFGPGGWLGSGPPPDCPMPVPSGTGGWLGSGPPPNCPMAAPSGSGEWLGSGPPPDYPMPYPPIQRGWFGQGPPPDCPPWVGPNPPLDCPPWVGPNPPPDCPPWL